MFDVFGSVKSLLKLDSVCIDNNVFRLHYKATVIILVAFSLLVTSRQYIGDPIDCIVDASIGGDIMDTYCWIHSTYTLPSKLGAEIGKHPSFLLPIRFFIDSGRPDFANLYTSNIAQCTIRKPYCLGNGRGCIES